jgi:ABC-type sugar transport system ATPase subunit
MEDLVVEHVNKSFDGVHALQDANFKASCGEVHAILGENGAGKSTLVKLLSCAIRPDSGKITLFGQLVHGKNPLDAKKLGIGTIYQELSLIPNLSVAANIFINSNKKSARIVLMKEWRGRTEELFQKYGVRGVDPGSITGDLPLPQRQMIEIVKVLSLNPKVVIFDEATSALSEENVKWLLSLAKQLATEGKIVLFISHRMSEIRLGCDRVTVFRNGHDVGEKRMCDTDSEELVAMMLGRKLSGYFPEKSGAVQEDKLLEVKNLCADKALQNVSFDIRRGEILGVGGLAGQGQAALLYSLYGVVESKGEVLLGGKRISLKNPKRSLKNNIALIPEDRATQGLVQPLSILDNIVLPILPQMKKGIFISKKKEMAVVSALMERLKIKAESPDTLVMTLSGGNQQKVVLAKLLAIEPTVFLMFDITRGVDVGTKVEIFSFIKELASKGHAILYYSTDVEELVNVCNDVLVMFDGRIISRLTEGSLTKENIIRASVGEEIIELGLII